MDAPDTLFEALTTPYRSLSRRGLRTLVLCLVLLSMVTTSIFGLLGAWPVVGFNGVEIGLALLLLHHNARGSRESELIQLEPTIIRILRIDARGRREERLLDPSWVRVVLHERAGRVPQLVLSNRGAHEEVGRHLGEGEKRDLAAALAQAVWRLHNPTFDNAQLRTG